MIMILCRKELTVDNTPKEYNLVSPDGKINLKMVCTKPIKLKKNRRAITYNLKEIFGVAPDSIVVKMADDGQTNSFQVCAIIKSVEAETVEPEPVPAKEPELWPENVAEQVAEEILPPDAELDQIDFDMGVMVELVENWPALGIPVGAFGRVIEKTYNEDGSGESLTIDWDEWGVSMIKPSPTTIVAEQFTLFNIKQ